MRRSTGNSAYFSLLKAGSAGAFALATILACSDSMSPREIVRVQVESIDIFVPDSVKQGLAAEFVSSLLNSPLGMSASAFASSAASLAGSACDTGAGPVYTKSRVAFTPELIPNIAPYPVYDDGVLPDRPLGFSFTFYGKTYDRVNVFSNGFLMFGPLPTPTPGFSTAGFIPFSASPNNIIAFAWTDWQPDMVSDPIRYETRGTAPHRKFIIQFNNVPEFASANRFNDIKTLGGLMSQVVLSEGSNDITIYTNKLKVVNTSHLVTQGIENETGTAAMFDSVQNVVTGNWGARRVRFFNLTDDALRFSPASTRDDEAPVIVAPAALTANNDPGLGSAVVAVSSPEASDNCALESVTPVRSDGAAIDAPYPVGVTTITWTAKDVSGNTATASQSVTVIDWEDPVITFVPANFSVNATSSLGAFVTYAFTAWDNVAVTSQSCEPALGSRLQIGPTEVTCSASDAAGHKVSRSFVVTVIDAPTQMMNLREYVISRGMPDGMTNPLVNFLDQAFADAGNSHGCKKMSDFIEMVETKGVPGSWAAYMTDEALRIMTVMQCSAISQNRRSQMKNK
jgi:hypothetical protein